MRPIIKLETVSDLDKMISHHVPDSPTLVLSALPDLRQELFFDFGTTELLCDCNKILDRKKPNGVLVVGREFSIHWQGIGQQVFFSERLAEGLRSRQNVSQCRRRCTHA